MRRQAMYIKRKASGVTLVELIIAMIIIGVVAVSLLQLFSKTFTSTTDPARRKQALLIAEGLMDEVMSAHFTFCDPSDPNAGTAAGTNVCAAATVEAMGPEAGNVRPFDNVNDYGPAFNFNNGAGAILDVNGFALALNGYAANLVVNPVLTAAQQFGTAPGQIISGSAPNAMQVLLITVTVSYGTAANDVVRLDAYRTRYAPNDF